MWCLAQSPRKVTTEDLRPQWKVLEEGQYVDYSRKSHDPDAIYVSLDAGSYRNRIIEAQGAKEYSIWVNGKLIVQSGGGITHLKIDSLARLYSSNLTFAFYVTRGIESLKTSLVAYTTAPQEEGMMERAGAFVKNFSIIGVLILAIYFVMLMQFNRRMMFDYFDVTRLFSLQERDESLVAGRITSRFSISIYVFLGLWLSFLLMMMFQRFDESWLLFNNFKMTSTGDGLLKWGKLSLIIYLIIFAKVALVFVFSAVFRLREGAYVQLLNYFRLISFILMVLSIIMLFYFVFHTRNPRYFENLISIVAWIMGAWALLIFLKLLRKSPYSVFHLFSYLCASEFFPIIILFKILFF